MVLPPSAEASGANTGEAQVQYSLWFIPKNWNPLPSEDTRLGLFTVTYTLGIFPKRLLTLRNTLTLVSMTGRIHVRKIQ